MRAPGGRRRARSGALNGLTPAAAPGPVTAVRRRDEPHGGPLPATDGSRWTRLGDATTLTCVYVVLLLVLPSSLVFAPLGASGTPANLLGLFLAIWWLGARVSGRLGVPAGLHPVRLALGALTASIMASYAWGSFTGWWAPENAHQSTDPVYSYVVPRPEQIHDAMVTAADRGLLSMLAWLGIALVLTDGLKTSAQVDRLLAWLVGAASVIAVIGVAQFVTGFNVASLFDIPGLTANQSFGEVGNRSVVRRVQATAIHPIEFGVIMATVVPLALHRALFAVARRRLAWVQVVLIGLCLPLSVSRSAVLVVAVAGLVLLLAWPSRLRWRALLLLPVALIGMRVVLPGVLGTVGSLFTNISSDPSTSGRLEDYAVAQDIFLGSPWLGRGLFTFVPQYYRIVDNALLVAAIELGAVGLIVLVALWTTAMASAWVSRTRSTSVDFRHRSAAVAASLAGLAVSYVTFDALAFNMTAGLTFVLIGTAGALLRLTPRPMPARAPRSNDPCLVADRLPSRSTP